MKWIKRAIRNWLGLNNDSSYPHRFVALITWHDKIIGVDGNGDVYELDLPIYNGFPVVQLIMHNPLGR